MIKAILIYTMFTIIITVSWKSYELIRFGEINPDFFHSIIALILGLSLTMNVLLFELADNG